MDDVIRRQVAIDALGDEPEVWTGKDEYAQGLNNQWHYDRNAILKCPSAQPERCEYCNEDADGFVTPMEKNGHVFIRFGMDGWELSLKANGWHGSAKIRYCPMCGRKLVE